MDRRKRTRCKVCGKRVNLRYSYKGNEINIFCPNCCSHGTLKRKPLRNSHKSL